MFTDSVKLYVLYLSKTETIRVNEILLELRYLADSIGRYKYNLVSVPR